MEKNFQMASHCSIGSGALYFAPEIPGYALDMHTMKGKAMGRGLEHFRSEGAKLVPPPTSWIPMRTKPIGCGRSNSRASEARCCEVVATSRADRNPRVLGEDADLVKRYRKLPPVLPRHRRQ